MHRSLQETKKNNKKEIKDNTLSNMTCCNWIDH